MPTLRLSSLVAVFALSSSCTLGLHYTRIGDADAAAEYAVRRQFTEGADPKAPQEARVMLDKLPEGIALDDNDGYEVRPGSGYTLIGHFKLFRALGIYFSNRTILAEAQRVARIVGGDVVIGRYILPRENRAMGIAGVIVKRQPPLALDVK